MKRARGLILMLSLLALPLAADVSLGATPYLERVFSDGETIEYDLSWLGVVGGRATLSVVPNGDQFTISTVARTLGAIGRLYPVRDEIESVVSRSNFSTLRFEKSLNERGRSKTELTILDPRRKMALRKGKEFPYQPPIFDPLSTIYYIRTLDLSPGARHEMTIIADDKIYPMEAIVLKREKLRLDGTVLDTVLVEPKMRYGGIFRDENQRLLIWFTDDARRVPVRIRSELEFGSITATLRSSRLTPPASTAGH